MSDAQGDIMEAAKILWWQKTYAQREIYYDYRLTSALSP